MVASARDANLETRGAGTVSAAATVAAVAAGGAIGAVLRLGATLGAERLLARAGAAPFPLGTLVVNVAGSFLLAWLLGAGERSGLPAGTRAFLGTGLLGALTTFSTFGLDAHALATGGRGGAALLYLGGTLGLSALAVVAGWALGRGA